MTPTVGQVVLKDQYYGSIGRRWGMDVLKGVWRRQCDIRTKADRYW